MTSKQRDPKYQCHAKRRYTDHDEAKENRARMAHQQGSPDLVLALEPYRCPWCHSVHLGHKPRWKYLRDVKHAAKRVEKARRKALWKESHGCQPTATLHP